MSIPVLRELTRLTLLLVWLVALPGGAQTHVVKPGDTLWDLSQQYKKDPAQWPVIQNRNQVASPKTLRPGTRLDMGPANGPRAMQVQALEGHAWLTRGGVQVALQLGSALRAGDVVATQADAFVTLVGADGSHVVLPTNSAVQLERTDHITGLRLLHGRIESHVQKQNRPNGFEVRSRAYNLGVRGTHFRVRDEAGMQTAEVLEGAVAAWHPTAGAMPWSDATPAPRSAKARSAQLQSARALSLTAGTGAWLNRPGNDVIEPLLAPPIVVNNEFVSGRVVTVQAQAGAQSHRLQLARDANFLALFYEQQGRGGSFTLPDSLPDGVYYLRLTALDAEGLEGQPSSNLLMLASGQADTQQTGAVHALPSGRYAIRWSTQPAQRYAFELSSSPDFSSLVQPTVELHNGGVIVGPLVGPARYYWRSEALDSEVGKVAKKFIGFVDVPG